MLKRPNHPQPLWQEGFSKQQQSICDYNGIGIYSFYLIFFKFADTTVLISNDVT
jgi:hypothetical protein